MGPSFWVLLSFRPCYPECLGAVVPNFRQILKSRLNPQNHPDRYGMMRSLLTTPYAQGFEMRRTLFVLALLSLAGTWGTSSAVAQQRPAYSGKKSTLVDQLDEFGRKLIDGVFPLPRKPAPQSPAPPTTPWQSDSFRIPYESNSPAPGGAKSTSSNRPVSTRAGGGTSTSTGSASEQHPRLPRSASSAYKPDRQQGTSESGGRQHSAASSVMPPLHERLKYLRESAFPDVEEKDSKKKDVPATQPKVTGSKPEAGSGPAKSLSTAADIQRSAASSKRAAKAPLVESRPAVAEPRIASRSVVAGSGESGLSPSQPAAKKPTPAPAPSSEAARPSESGDDSASDDNVLFTRQSPILAVETLGPRRITVGKESVYELTIRNSGQVAAEQVVVTIDLPTWAEVLGAEATRGETTSPISGQDVAFSWRVGRVGAASKEKLVLRIVPRQSGPLDLAVKWASTPVGSQAMIEVQEPKLQMRIEGPREVLHGESEVYRLELVNSGTGDAEAVEISLAPVGTGNNTPARHRLGTVKAGEKKVIEVELTARQAGSLAIKVDARGDGVEAHLIEEIVVLQPALQIDIQSPEFQYVGTEATYRIRVSNPGTAAAKNVAVTASIPAGARYVSGAAGAHVSPEETSVTWALGVLEVGEEETLELTCGLGREGLSRLEVVSSAKGGLTTSKQATVKVEAIADLELDVTDPSGPVPVGSEATYQVRVHNRGTKSAEEVEVVAYFSQGIEPISVRGGRHRTAPGQVLFDKISSLAAGQDVEFEIKAKAETAGNHICRVEVYCKPLDTRLVSEETTHFYGGTQPSRHEPSSSVGRSDTAGPADESAPSGGGRLRTADQRPRLAPRKAQ